MDWILSSIARLFRPPFISAYGQRGLMPLPVWRAVRRVSERVKPWLLVEGGTDCDGMRGGSIQFFWTKRGAEASLEHSIEWADGPHGGEIHCQWTREARECAREFRAWNDDRDRFAERANY
ncbi:hypothetical protein CMI37_28380 [Candidatus Pacearchaeota archaeon]|nr:hypothetical protein [Candidatus Pacearchaeota archaeon]